MKRVTNFYIKHNITPYRLGWIDIVIDLLMVLFIVIYSKKVETDTIVKRIPEIIAALVICVSSCYAAIRGRCTDCGRLNTAGARYCRRCGNDMDSTFGWQKHSFEPGDKSDMKTKYYWECK